MYSNFIPVTGNRMSSPGWSTLPVVAFIMYYMVPSEQDWWKQIGNQQSFTCNVENIDESPATRDIYIRKTGCDVFPLHFCKTRWVEDNPVPARGIQMWANIIQYWLSLSRSKRPHNKSFDTLVKCHADKLIISKLHFVKKYISSILKLFLL